MTRKISFLLIMFAGFSVPAMSQAPEAVLNAFSQMFPNATDVEWEMDEDTWEVEFEMGDDEEYEADFAPDGTWLETEKEIRTDKVPVIVLGATAKYPGYKLKEALELSTADITQAFELTIKKGSHEVEMLVSSTGQVLKVEDAEDDN